MFQSFNLVTRSTAIKNVLTADVPDMPFFKVLFGIFSKEQKMHALESLDKVGIRSRPTPAATSSPAASSSVSRLRAL